MKRLLSALFVCLCATALFAQGTKEDYSRAFGIARKYSNKMTHGNVNVSRSGEYDFRYSTFTGDSTEYFSLAADGTRSKIENPDRDRRRRPHQGYRQRHWAEVPDEKDGQSVSPTDTSISILTVDNNLVVKRRGQEDVVLTTDGTDTCYYSSWGRWSADGRYYATVMIKPAPKHYVTYVQSSPQNQLQPITTRIEYAKPGDSLNYRLPVVIDVEAGRVIKPSSDALFRSQYYVSAPQWDEENRHTLTFEFNERGHKTFRVLEMNLEGNVCTLIEERNDKYVAYSRNLRRNFGNHHILWKSDRDGHAHLYLLDRRKDVLRQVTKGNFWVRNVLSAEVDERGKGYVIFTANGRGYRNQGRVMSSRDGSLRCEDPYNLHCYRVELPSCRLVELTPEAGNHTVTLNASATALVDTWSTPTVPPQTVLRSAHDGRVIRELEKADIARLEKQGWTAPEVFVAPGRDGKTDIWGIIQRPSNFDPSRKYPVIEYIYSGPGDQYVPKSFTPWIWTHTDLAELGFIVVQMDGMTTSFRDLDFEQVCYKNLADAGFPDRKAWIRAAAEKYPYMDTERVGIYGCSAGGQEALAALLFHGDFYKAAYSACGCHDNRMDKIWWNEQWMGYPVDSCYIRCSNVENAHLLKGKLMLLVGEMDDNVDPASTYQVVDALQRAGKDFEFIMLPGAKHTMGEAYGEHKRYDFFVRNLLGVSPPEWK